jgi:orotidine-5'-phosphate decarboxylase
MTAIPAQQRSGAKERLIVALDLPNAKAAADMAGRLRGHVGMFKVGSELFTAEGSSTLHGLVSASEKVFLDLKFHDIPNTVRAAVRAGAKLGVSMIDVHASGGRKMMEAAIEGAHDAEAETGNRPQVIAVTVLTSLGPRELHELGISSSPEEIVLRWAELAQGCGLDGVVASPQEVEAIRRVCGRGFIIVTPGIRPQSAATDDQARTATPEFALKAGANFLVVGRPITTAPDPAAATDAIVGEVARALGDALEETGDHD